MDIIKPFGKTDVLLYYSKVAKKLKGFLKDKEIAAKIWLPFGFFIRRGSKVLPLYVEEFEAVTKDFLKIRSQLDLKKARREITKQQEKLWLYFPPGRLADFFYATNKEGRDKTIDRIFFDIDRGKGTSVEQAQEVTLALLQTVRKDKELKKKIKFKTAIFWTGKSFHLYLLLKKKMPNSFYEKYISYSKNKPLKSFTGQWAEKINKQLSVGVIGGHEKTIKTIIIDPSQTPSGKLARCPFSLHMKSSKEIDGISVPLSEKQLKDKALIKKLQALTPESVIKNLGAWAKNLPR